MTFEQCCSECLSNKELIREFNRLTGLHLGESRTGIEIAVDEACGRDPDAESIPEFVSFVYDCVWSRLVVQQ